MRGWVMGSFQKIAKPRALYEKWGFSIQLMPSSYLWLKTFSAKF